MKDGRCSICRGECLTFNDPRPIPDLGMVCGECNRRVVLPVRHLLGWANNEALAVDAHVRDLESKLLWATSSNTETVAALEALVRWCDDDNGYYGDEITAARAAIAKAKGGAA